MCGAGAAHALPARSTVVLGHDRSEGFGALMALSDVLVGDPVVGSRHFFHKTERVVHSCRHHVQRRLGHLCDSASDEPPRLYFTHLGAGVGRPSLSVTGLTDSDGTTAPAQLWHWHPVTGAGVTETLSTSATVVLPLGLLKDLLTAVTGSDVSVGSPVRWGHLVCEPASDGFSGTSAVP